jgi:hypothetical protein
MYIHIIKIINTLVAFIVVLFTLIVLTLILWGIFPRYILYTIVLSVIYLLTGIYLINAVHWSFKVYN